MWIWIIDFFCYLSFPTTPFSENFLNTIWARSHCNLTIIYLFAILWSSLVILWLLLKHTHTHTHILVPYFWGRRFLGKILDLTSVQKKLRSCYTLLAQFLLFVFRIWAFWWNLATHRLGANQCTLLHFLILWVYVGSFIYVCLFLIVSVCVSMCVNTFAYAHIHTLSMCMCLEYFLTHDIEVRSDVLFTSSHHQ